MNGIIIGLNLLSLKCFQLILLSKALQLKRIILQNTLLANN